MSITIITHKNHLKQLHAEWQQAEQRVSINQAFEWVMHWLNIFGKSTQLRIIQHQPTNTFLPLVIKNKRYKKIFPVKVIQFLGSPEADWCDIVSTGFKANEHLATIWKQALNTHWHEMLLHNIPEQSTLIPFLSALVKKNNKTILKPHTKCYYINTTGKWETYLQNQTSKQFVQQDTRRLFRRLNEAGLEVSLEKSTLNNIASDIAEMDKMNGLSQARKGRKSVYASKQRKLFIENLLTHLGPKNHVKLFYLCFNKQKVAYVLAFYHNNIFYYYNIGFNTAYKKYSPSKLLLYQLIKQCFNDNTTEFNFMRGESEYKLKWTKQYRVNYQFKMLNPKKIINLFRSVS